MRTVPLRPIDQDLLRWSRRKWFWFTGGLLALQVAAVLWFSTSNSGVRKVYPVPPAVAFQPYPAAARHPLDELEDPMLFARANRHGFSSAAWAKPALQVAILSQPRPVPFLGFKQAKSLMDSGLQSAPAELIFARKLPAPLENPALLGHGVSTQSILRVEGPLASRPLLKRPELPSEYFNDALGNTLIEIGVNPDGFVLSARVLDTSESKQADLDALAIAKRLRFEPQRRSTKPNDLTWGKLVFEWFGLEFPKTFAPASAK